MNPGRLSFLRSLLYGCLFTVLVSPVATQLVKHGSIKMDPGLVLGSLLTTV